MEREEFLSRFKAEMIKSAPSYFCSRGMTKERTIFDDAHDALNRMSRAAKRGTGCHLTADMIAALALTAVGSLWDDADPRGDDQQNAGGGK